MIPHSFIAVIHYMIKRVDQHVLWSKTVDSAVVASIFRNDWIRLAHQHSSHQTREPVAGWWCKQSGMYTWITRLAGWRMMAGDQLCMRICCIGTCGEESSLDFELCGTWCCSPKLIPCNTIKNRSSNVKWFRGETKAGLTNHFTKLWREDCIRIARFLRRVVHRIIHVYFWVIAYWTHVNHRTPLSARMPRWSE